MSRILFAASEAYFPAAEQELRAAFRSVRIERLAPDLGCIDGAGMDIAQVAEACLRRPIVFVRHLTREMASVPAAVAIENAAEIGESALRIVDEHAAGPALALQVWLSGESPLRYRPDELWKRVAERLRRAGLDVARGSRDLVLSVIVTPREVIVGLNRREHALVDWPGGRVGLARPADQISRSEFKLEELFKVSAVPGPIHGVALDLGASPGGWTRILRRRGLTLWAIDPAELDPRLVRDPGVHYVPETAGRFFARNRRSFDLIVNDMRMTADRSCRVMLEAAEHLKPNGVAITTIKLSPRRALEIVRSSMRTLDLGYEILQARQLFHNRNEVTLVARRRSGRPARR